MCTQWRIWGEGGWEEPSINPVIATGTNININILIGGNSTVNKLADLKFGYADEQQIQYQTSECVHHFYVVVCEFCFVSFPNTGWHVTL